jgi:hypothetical protein
MDQIAMTEQKQNPSYFLDPYLFIRQHEETHYADQDVSRDARRPE